MCIRDRSSIALADMQDITAQPLAVHVPLTGHLLARRQYGLQLAEVDQHRPRILALLDDAGDDVALAAGVLAESELILGIPQALQDDLPRGGGRDSAETIRGVVILPGHLAVLGQLRGPDVDVSGAAVDLDPGRGGDAVAAVIGLSLIHISE